MQGTLSIVGGVSHCTMEQTTRAAMYEYLPGFGGGETLLLYLFQLLFQHLIYLYDFISLNIPVHLLYKNT